jgi:hypothetical protein
LISQIRNPWIRRPLVVLLGPPTMFLAILCDVLAPLEEYVRNELLDNVDSCWRDLVAAWRGPRKVATGGVLTQSATTSLVGETPSEQYITRKQLDAILIGNNARVRSEAVEAVRRAADLNAR